MIILKTYQIQLMKNKFKDLQFCRSKINSKLRDLPRILFLFIFDSKIKFNLWRLIKQFLMVRNSPKQIIMEFQLSQILMVIFNRIKNCKFNQKKYLKIFQGFLDELTMVENSPPSNYQLKNQSFSNEIKGFYIHPKLVILDKYVKVYMLFKI